MTFKGICQRYYYGVYYCSTLFVIVYDLALNYACGTYSRVGDDDDDDEEEEEEEIIQLRMYRLDWKWKYPINIWGLQINLHRHNDRNSLY